MTIEAIYIVGILFVLVSIVTGLIMICSKNNKGTVQGSFYSDEEYAAIATASNQAGKWNSPFIKDKEIVEIMEYGCELVRDKDFRGIGDCNERASW